MFAEVNWAITIPASICGTICLSAITFICVWGCRTKEAKNELVGIEGRVKITNPDEYQEEVNANNIPAELLSEKIHKTAKRSLPDLPVDLSSQGRNENAWEPNGDTTSELYATVVLQDEKSKNKNWQKSNSESVNQSGANSSTKQDHPYDKLKKLEHPYAQVKEEDNNQESLTTSHLTSSQEETLNIKEFEAGRVSSSRSESEAINNIPAATAISGNVSANEDLPYMTPPAHFSGDSQDSGKGYTSISVREPLSAILAESNSTSRPVDPHYATVSDDSDDMYAAIDDPNQAYTSGSETYAQIHNGSNNIKSAPQPPSVDILKQMTISSQSHSRQDSVSSLASSTMLNTPKPEKRPFNSPLPPTPSKSPDCTEDSYTEVVKTLKQLSSPKNVEEMYAKVNKKSRRDTDSLERGGSTESGVSESSDSLSFKLQTNTTDSSHSCLSYLSKSPLTDTSSSNGFMTIDSLTTEKDLQPGYEKLGSLLEYNCDFDGCYETVRKSHSSDSEPEYEKLKPHKHNYVNIKQTNDHSQNYSSLEKLASDVGDGYERVKVNSQVNEIYSKIDASESDDYARVEPQENLGDACGYAKIRKRVSHNDIESKIGKKNSEYNSEPTYESLGNEFEGDEQYEPNYESVDFVPKNHVDSSYQKLTEQETSTIEN